MLRWRRGTTQRGRSWSWPCSARSTSSQGSAASTGKLTIKISSRTAQLFWLDLAEFVIVGITFWETFRIHNCEGQIHQEIFWLVSELPSWSSSSLLWSVKSKWSFSSSQWKCGETLLMFLAGILTPSSSSCQTEGPPPNLHIFLSHPFLFFSLTSCKNFQRAEQAANKNSGEHKPPAVEPELRLLERATRWAAPTSAWSYGLGLW